MRYSTINPELFIHNRRGFLSKMENNSIAIFHSNDLMPKNADQVMKFKQNSDLFYLSGYNINNHTILNMSCVLMVYFKFVFIICCKNLYQVQRFK